MTATAKDTDATKTGKTASRNTYKSASTPRPQRIDMTGSWTVHTRFVQALFEGRRRATTHDAIVSLKRFAANTRGLCEASANDDPYADARLIEIDKAMDDAQNQIDTNLLVVDTQLARIDTQNLHLPDTGSLKPVTYELDFASRYAKRATVILTRMDELVRKALKASEWTLLDGSDWHSEIEWPTNKHGKRIQKLSSWAIICELPKRRMRHAFEVSNRGAVWSGVNRNDIAANNAKAREAELKYGGLDHDVLRGDKRGRLTPPMRDSASGSTEDAPEAVEN